MSGAPIPAGPDALAVLSDEPRRVIILSDYHRMLETGILREDDRVELIEGAIVEVSETHAQVIQRLGRLLYRSLPDEFAIRCRRGNVFGPSRPAGAGERPLRLTEETDRPLTRVTSVA